MLTKVGNNEQELNVFIAVLVRRLRPCRTYDDFVRAWYPDQGFDVAGRGPLLGVNVTDEREILTLSFIDLASREDLETALQRVADQERVRHDRLTDVIESTTVRAIYEQRDEFDFSSDATVAKGRPAYLDSSGR